GVSARSASSSATAERKRQLVQISSSPSPTLTGEPHCAQTDSALFASAFWFLFTPRPLTRCKDNAALGQSHRAPKLCERSLGAQFRDNAAAADGHASLLPLSEDRCAPTPHRTTG